MQALLRENALLLEEVHYYRRLLFSDITPQSGSILNALRKAVDICDQNKQLRSFEEMSRLSELCRVLEEENKHLKKLC